MIEPMTMTPEQEAAIEEMLSPKAIASGGCLNGSELGVGKTGISVEFCKRFGAKVILIIAPLQTLGKPLKEDDERSEGWRGTFAQQQVELPFKQIANTPEGQAALADYEWHTPGVYFIGQEYFVRLGWNRSPEFNRDGTPKLLKNGKQKVAKQRTPLWGRTQPDVVIFDEVHRAQNGSSMTVQTLMGGVRGTGALNARYKIGASGTPTGNNFNGAWAVTRWLWPDIIDQSEYVWREKWAKIEYDHFAVRNQKVVGEKVEGAFFAGLPCYIRIESDLDIEVDEQNIEVDLSSEQRRVYAELEAMSVAWLADHPLVVKFPITKRIRQRQATLGMPTLVPTDDGDYGVTFALDCESSKIDRMWSILDDDFDGETALIFTDSQIFADVLVHRLNLRYGDDSARKWSGKVSQADRAVNKADYIAGKFRFMVAVIAASGTGTDGLQFATRNMLYMSSDNSRILNEQSVGRTLRRGQSADKVRIRRILARDTIDFGQLSKQVEAALAMNRTLKKRGGK